MGKTHCRPLEVTDMLCLKKAQSPKLSFFPLCLHQSDTYSVECLFLNRHIDSTQNFKIKLSMALGSQRFKVVTILFFSLFIVSSQEKKLIKKAQNEHQRHKSLRPSYS